jgi:hypothetical protein
MNNMMGFSGQSFIIIIIIIPVRVLGVINFQNIIELIVLPVICDGIPMYSMLLDIDLDERHGADFQGYRHPVSKWQILLLFRAICSQDDLAKSFITSPKKPKEKSFQEKNNSPFCHWQNPTHI